jgi:hypothetical protein
MHDPGKAGDSFLLVSDHSKVKGGLGWLVAEPRPQHNSQHSGVA